MLLGENIADPYLKLDMIDLDPIDENDNDLLEAGELVVINMDIRNFMQTYSADNASMTLTSTSSDVSIIDGDGSMDIGADSIMSIIDQFQIEISEDAQAQMAEFNLHIEADIEIAVNKLIKKGQKISFDKNTRTVNRI